LGPPKQHEEQARAGIVIPPSFRPVGSQQVIPFWPRKLATHRLPSLEERGSKDEYILQVHVERSAHTI